MKRFFGITLIILLLLIAYLFLYPVGITPEAWKSPPAPSLKEGMYQANDQLASIQKINLEGSGPEDLAFNPKGELFTGMEDGRIIVMQKDGSRQRLFLHTQGRPLGLKFDSRGNLIVADAVKGLLSVNPEGKSEILATQYGNLPFKLTDDLDIASDGKIYFTDASHKFGVGQLIDYSLESGPTGRFLVYDPKKRQSILLKDKMYFPNGVALSPDESFVLVCETFRHRVTRYWLKGEKKGRSDVFADNFPGYPDGINWNGHDLFWVSLANPRNKTLEALSPYPFWKKVLRRLPAFLLPKPVPYGFVIGLDENGKVIYNLQDTTKRFGTITNTLETEGKLYFGSLSEKAIGVIETSKLKKINP